MKIVLVNPVVSNLLLTVIVVGWKLLTLRLVYL